MGFPVSICITASQILQDGAALQNLSSARVSFSQAPDVPNQFQEIHKMKNKLLATWKLCILPQISFIALAE